MRLDADDYLDKNALMIMAHEIEQNKDVGMVFPDYFLVDESGQEIEVYRRHDFASVSMYDQPAHGACTLIRKDCLESMGGYEEKLRAHDGYELWIRFIKQFKVSNIRLPLFYYRKHGNSLTSNKNRIIRAREEIFQIHTKNIEMNGVAIIPIRGTEENRELCLTEIKGKKVVDWTLEAALNSKYLRQLIVSTDDIEIANYIQKLYGSKVTVSKRDNQLARKNIPLESVLKELIDQIRVDLNTYVFLPIETPFRGSKEIDSAIEVMKLFDADSVIGVRPEVDGFYYHDGGGLKPIRSSERLRLEREELYRDVGAIKLVRKEFFQKNFKILGGKIGHLLMSDYSSINLREPFGMQLAKIPMD
jgi:CMP-N-acetylneuraminic acid synthetase